MKVYYYYSFKSYFAKEANKQSLMLRTISIQAQGPQSSSQVSETLTAEDLFASTEERDTTFICTTK